MIEFLIGLMQATGLLALVVVMIALAAWIVSMMAPVAVAELMKAKKILKGQGETPRPRY